MGGHPGREFVLESDKLTMQFRLYLLDKTLYQVLVVATTSMASRAGTNRFLDSFELQEGSAGANWKRYRFDADKFSAEYPGEPKLSKKGTQTGYMLSLENDNFAYYVQKADYPDLNKTSEQFFDDYARGAAQSMKTEPRNQRSISLSGYPGREFTSENERSICKVRLYLVGKTSYAVMVYATKSMASRAETDRFLDSFEFIK